MITGTLAVDYLGHYPATFHGLPRHAGINLSIHLDAMERSFGGCAMNIAYGLKLLGHDPVPVVFVGRDFDDAYQAHLDALGIDQSGIVMVDAPTSSRGFIITDQEGNQFTAFYPGPARFHAGYAEALAEKLTGQLAEQLGSPFDYAILAPDFPNNMIPALGLVREHGIPALVDPGQVLTDFDAGECKQLLADATSLVVNEYEHATLVERIGAEAMEHLECMVITRAEQGATWRMGNRNGTVPPVLDVDVVEPTGCGDAFRAGYVDALLRGADIEDACRAGSLVAAISLGSIGAQAYNLDDYPDRYARVWGTRPDWLVR